MSATSSKIRARRVVFEGKQEVRLAEFELAARRFSMADMNTHYFSPSACLEVHKTANRERGKTMGIVFDWRKES